MRVKSPLQGVLVSTRASPKRAIHLRFRLLGAARRFASFLVLLRPGCGLDARTKAEAFPCLGVRVSTRQSTFERCVWGAQTPIRALATSSVTEDRPVSPRTKSTGAC